MEHAEELIAGLLVGRTMDLVARLQLGGEAIDVQPIGTHLPNAAMRAFSRDPHLRSLCLRARETGTPVFEGNVVDHAPELGRLSGCGSYALIPLGGDDLLCIMSHREYAFEPDSVERLVRLVALIRGYNTEHEENVRHMRRLVIQLTEAEDRERQRIAALLHDDLQQTLAGIKVHVGMAARRARDNPYIAGRLATAVDLLNAAIEGSRSLSHELSPPMLRLRGFVPALRVLAAETERTHQLRVTIDAPETEPHLSELSALVTYRAVQELLFNTIKHAGVREATVEILSYDAGVRVAVRDHGRGFDVGDVLKRDSPNGLGLLSLRERIEAIGGVLEIESADGTGSTFTIFLPNDATRAEGVIATRTYPVPPQALNGRKLSVLVADDHAVIRQGLVLLLNEEPDIEVVGEASDGEDAVDLANRLRPDVVVMDLTMPGMTGDEATRAILSAAPFTRVIGLSMHSEEDARDRMLASGAAAYLSKAGPSTDLLDAIRRP